MGSMFFKRILASSFNGKFPGLYNLPFPISAKVQGGCKFSAFLRA